MTADLQQAMDQLARKRQQAAEQKRRIGMTERPLQPVANKLNGLPMPPEPMTAQVLGNWMLAQQTAPVSGDTPPTARRIEGDAIREYLGLVSLSDLRTEHMAPEAAVVFKKVLAGIQAWRARLDTLPPRDPRGRVFILCSTVKGVGKTHIAKSVLTTFCHVTAPVGEDTVVFEDGTTNFSLERRGIVYTAPELTERFDGGASAGDLIRYSHELVVIDDLGREGNARYRKDKQELQAEERQARYYRLINHCYERTQNGRPVNLFITSNLPFAALESFFNDATWSRLEEMAPAGCSAELKGIPSWRKLRSGR